MAAPFLEAARYRACASVGLAFAPLICLMAAPCRACIRSAHLLDGCALSGLHSLRSFFLLLFFFLLVVAVLIGNAEFHEPLQNLFLRNLRRFVTGLLQHGQAPALNLPGTQRGKNHKAVLTVDVIGNGYQAIPPKEAMISSMRLCWRHGAAVPLCTIDSRTEMEFSRMSLMMM